MAIQTVTRDLKVSARLMITFVTAENKALANVDTRKRGDTNEQAYADYLEAFITDENVIDLQNEVNALITFPDGNKIFVALMESDTQCKTCGSAQNVNQGFCSECAKRVKVTKTEGEMTAIEKLKAKMAAKAAQIDAKPEVESKPKSRSGK
jgi:hypothetical protein